MTKKKADAAGTRAAKGSAQEAIGKLIGDDAARLRGAAEQKTAAGQRKAASHPMRDRQAGDPETEDR